MKRRQTLRLAGLASLLSPMAARAASAATEPVGGDLPPELSGSGAGMTGSLVWVIVALLFVIVLIVLVVKWLSQRNRGWGANRSLRSLGGIPLGQNKSLQVVEFAGRIYVVGVGDQVSLLDKIDDPREAQAVIAEMERQAGAAWNAASLKDALGRLRNRKGDPEPADERWQEAESFQTMLQDRLNRQSGRKQKVEELLKEQNQNDRLLDE